MKVDNKKYGVIVRSVGERTEQLCIDAIKLYMEPFIVKNISPHVKANLTMYKIMLDNPKEWWLSVDADVILSKNWYHKMDELVKDCDGVLSSIPKEYEFILDRIHNRGCRTYNGKFIKYCYENIKKNYDNVVNNLFPEDAARRMINNKFNKTRVKKNVLIGFHGFEQYYTHIYNAYVRYAIRTKGDKNEKNLIKSWKPKRNLNIKDRQIAIKGWNDGWNNPNLIKTKDFTNYIAIKPEKEPCKMSIEEFYNKYNGYLK